MPLRWQSDDAACAAEPGAEPVFSQPRMEGAVLPGGLHYLSVVAPKAGTDRSN